MIIGLDFVILGNDVVNSAWSGEWSTSVTSPLRFGPQHGSSDGFYYWYGHPATSGRVETGFR